jgi:uncharacterized protein YbbC (DUF1343 family)
MKRSSLLRGLLWCAGGAAVCARRAAPAHATTLPASKVMLGDEVFLRETWRELGRRSIGIVTNQTGVTAQLESIVDAARRNPAIALRAIYSPEHGLRGDQPAGRYIASYIDERTGLPVYSLYGATRRPTPAMLSGVDVVLVDVQDIGARSYTYISTMAYVMQSARELGKEVWVLDRPNPIGGELVEGPVLEPRFSSFVGLYPIAMRHGMTIGELARLFNEEFGIGCGLRVIAMRNYRRTMLWPDTGLAWVQSSPNIPEWDTTLVYPTTGLVDQAGINNGTGFTKPFKYAGGFGVDAERLAAYLNARSLPGVHFRAAAWSPIAGFWANKTLSGVELIVFDPRAYRAVRTAVELLVAMRSIAPRPLAYVPALDRDWGTDTLRVALEGGASAETILRQWEPGVRSFGTARARYLLY